MPPDTFLNPDDPRGMLQDPSSSVKECVAQFGEFDFDGFNDLIDGVLYVGYMDVDGLAGSCTFSDSGYGCTGFSIKDPNTWFVGLAKPPTPSTSL